MENQWISVKDRLPIKGTVCLTCNIEDKITIRSYEGDGTQSEKWRFEDDFGESDEWGTSHWMPLPEPPEPI